MKPSVSSYSFQQLLSSGKARPVDLIGLAKRLGFAAIEYTDIRPADGLTAEETACILREESEKQGLPIINYTVGADFLKAPSIGQEIERLCEQVEIAKLLGATGMRHDASGGFPAPQSRVKGFAQALPLLAEGCRAVTEYAAKRGIATMVENHGFFCQDSLRVAALVAQVGHENFGALVDIGNFLCADEAPALATGNVAPFAKHVHAKDFHIKSGAEDAPGEGYFLSRSGNYLRGAILGHGCVPVRQCLGILKRQGYQGYVSIEFEGMEDCETALRIGCANLRRTIEAL
ncbi:MAG: sugar phosphate isomerase/epimerase [Oscillospiraceae bacterium]|jgi:sugar phosphate isomerase/epimerase|nr:sugar phosphate isomerase/epimerase [Oscillospiraceae bacterium]